MPRVVRAIMAVLRGMENMASHCLTSTTAEEDSANEIWDTYLKLANDDDKRISDA